MILGRYSLYLHLQAPMTMINIHPIVIDRIVLLRDILKIHIHLKRLPLMHQPLALSLHPKGNARRLHNPVSHALPRLVPDGELVDVDVVGLVVVEDDVAGRGDELGLVAGEVVGHLFVGEGVVLAEVYATFYAERALVFGNHRTLLYCGYG
jgi:hypothetical protein